MSRKSREAELRLLVESEAGQNELHFRYSQSLGIDVGKLPARGIMGEIMIEAILDHEFPPEDLPTEGK